VHTVKKISGGGANSLAYYFENSQYSKWLKIKAYKKCECIYIVKINKLRGLLILDN
jgi:hypothetical protein